MKKIIVIGSGGAGKSTFSKRLAEALTINVIHLDQLYWKPNWVEPSKEEWARTVEELLKGESWIMDGNYGGTREMRVRACDTVIFLDMPRYLCLYRVLKRALAYRGKNRPDMAEGCNEKMDIEFVLWVWNYPNRARPLIEAELKQYEDNKMVIRLRSTREVEDFLVNYK